VPRLPFATETASADAYLALLDGALLDRSLSESEKDALIDVAMQLSLSRQDIVDLHRGYLKSLAAVALADAVVTETERAELNAVAAMLGLAERDVDAALAEAAGIAARGAPGWQEFTLSPDDQVAFTGEMSRSREEWTLLAKEAGLRVGGVNRRTRLVVAADPDSLSGKAQTARHHKIPIINEDAFSRMLSKMRARPPLS
jgi:DNA polymerase-3 subunit epsilon